MKGTTLAKMLVLGLILVVCRAGLSQAAPMGTGFTYQGQLIDANKPADGLYDLQFKLYDANIAGTQKGNTIDVNEMDVIDGYFTMLLDFGSGIFDGNDRWLEIGVRPGELNDPNAYTVLNPRQQVTPTPYALYAQSSGGLQTSGDLVLKSDSGNVDVGGPNDPTILNVFGNWRMYSPYEPGELGVLGVYPTDFEGASYGTPSEIEWDFGDGIKNATTMTLYTSKGSKNSIALCPDSNNVLVGTSNRAVNLNVYGALDVAGDVRSSGKIIASAFASNSPLIFEAPSGTKRMLIDDITGNVGIGTTAPGAKLEVNGNIKTAGIYETYYTSNNWTPVESNRRWYSVAMSSDGTKQTAVDYGGQIYISTDSGNTWTAKESNRWWHSVAMSSDGTKQTAVVYGGQIYVSTDSGNTWIAKESNRNWLSVAMSADWTKQTAVVSEGQIYVSTDSGNTWTAKESSRSWWSVAMSADGTKQTAVAWGGQIYISTDSGNTWIAKGSNRNWDSVAMSADGTKQTAVGWYGQIYVSTDSGNTWTAKESIRYWRSVAMSADGTKQTAVVNNGQIYVSTDSGNTWTPKESNREWYSVAMSADGTKQTAVVSGGQIYIYISYIGVGIGTTAPGAKLEVNGQVKITGGSPGNGKVLTSDASGLATWQTAGGGADDDWAWSSGSGLTGDIYHTGRVGIGTAPDKLLTVDAADGVANNDYVARFQNRNSGAGQNYGVYIKAGSSGSDLALQIDNTSGKTLLSVDGESKVGIGTKSPGAYLTINPTVTNLGILVGHYGIYNHATIGDGTQIITYYGSYIAAPTISGGSIGSKYALVTEADAGDVGIGTTSPVRKLHVNDVMRLEPRGDFPADPADGDLCVKGEPNGRHIYCYLNGDWRQLD